MMHAKDAIECPPRCSAISIQCVCLCAHGCLFSIAPHTEQTGECMQCEREPIFFISHSRSSAIFLNRAKQSYEYREKKKKMNVRNNQDKEQEKTKKETQQKKIPLLWVLSKVKYKQQKQTHSLAHTQKMDAERDKIKLDCKMTKAKKAHTFGPLFHHVANKSKVISLSTTVSSFVAALHSSHQFHIRLLVLFLPPLIRPFLVCVFLFVL